MTACCCWVDPEVLLLFAEEETGGLFLFVAAEGGIVNKTDVEAKKLLLFSVFLLSDSSTVKRDK